ncbi:MAG: hypothetical protein V1887_04120 [Candidatus Aenigmatarchaeota archaeon]
MAKKIPVSFNTNATKIDPAEMTRLARRLRKSYADVFEKLAKF